MGDHKSRFFLSDYRIGLTLIKQKSMIYRNLVFQMASCHHYQDQKLRKKYGLCIEKFYILEL